ncbi:hypothetical protein DFO70_12042 [Cytobacillus firmus]|uniref:Uncharacterized protein n=2 Tax=Cytobacillus TaxID=2675230 RepID=A0A366JJS4_CYTFI|nr:MULTISPECIES: hypothetical protein [Cytobacillus]RBP87385.1 hypothetical protein DFO70_12042 [Cytobacillus firmus]TDX37085.1 hypothetical protein DFO72_11644 [Cytobacillus oceanisediminis]
MKNLIAFTAVFLIWTLLSLMLTGIDIPIPSSYIALIITTNAVFAFFSIFVQKLVIILYEVNVYEKPKTLFDYCFKYIAIITSGVNYHIQNLLNRLPLILNKLASVFFFIFLIFTGFGLMAVFN